MLASLVCWVSRQTRIIGPSTKMSNPSVAVNLSKTSGKQARGTFSRSIQRPIQYATTCFGSWKYTINSVILPLPHVKPGEELVVKCNQRGVSELPENTQPFGDGPTNDKKKVTVAAERFMIRFTATSKIMVSTRNCLGIVTGADSTYFFKKPIPTATVTVTVTRLGPLLRGCWGRNRCPRREIVLPIDVILVFWALSCRRAWEISWNNAIIWSLCACQPFHSLRRRGIIITLDIDVDMLTRTLICCESESKLPRR